MFVIFARFETGLFRVFGNHTGQPFMQRYTAAGALEQLTQIHREADLHILKVEKPPLPPAKAAATRKKGD